MKRILLSLLFLFAASCSTTEDRRYTASDPSLSFPYNPESGTAQQAKKVFPWEIWTPTKDMDGLPLVNFNILAGDELAKKGDRSQALAKYQSVQRARLLPQEEEALVFRIASTQLALQRAPDALKTLSDYFTRRNEAVDFVSPAFCILLGYSYGYNNNIEQSLAWFSRVHKIGSTTPRYNVIAASGVKEFLSRVPAETFEQTAAIWSSDEYVRALIAEERALRAQRGVVTADPNFGAQFPTLPPVTGAPSGVVNIGVYLPLTGKYAVLGTNTKNGLELALQGKQISDSRNQSLKIELSYKDAGDGTGDTPLKITEMVASYKPTVLIGPLLSEEAVAAADTARQYRVPMITFSKKNSFTTGAGVFRLGATARSQVDSLLARLADEMRITQFALVYANDANGQEFAESYRAALAARSLRPAFERSYGKDDMASFLSIAQELEQYPIQAILFPDNLLAASRFFSNITPKKLATIKIVGTASWDDPVQLARYSTILQGAIYPSPFFISSTDENIKNFIALYRGRYKVQPDFLAAQGYDTGVLVQNALNTAMSQNSNFEASLLRYKNYEGLTGVMSVQPNGEIERSFKIVEFKDGAIRELLSTLKTNFVLRGNEPVAPVIQ